MHTKYLAACAATTAGAIAITGLALAPASASASDVGIDITSAARQFDREGRRISDGSSAELRAAMEGVATAKRSAKAVTSDNDYYIRDTYTDAYYDTYAVPGLLGSSVAVPRSNGANLLGVGLLDAYSSGSMTISGGAALLIDANADGQTDYMAMTPDSYMSLDSGYTSPISRKVSGNWVSTGQSAVWLRGDDYYGVSLDWKALGVKNVQWTFGVMDPSGDSDFAPDAYGSTIDLGYGQSVAPAPTPPPSTGGGSVQSLPAKVGAITVTKRKGRTKIDWPNTPGAQSYRVKVSTNGSKYRTWGTVGSSKATLSTKAGRNYSVAVQAKNAAGYGQARYRTFRSR